MVDECNPMQPGYQAHSTKWFYRPVGPTGGLPYNFSLYTTLLWGPERINYDSYFPSASLIQCSQVVVISGYKGVIALDTAPCSGLVLFFLVRAVPGQPTGQ
jgi:hypothetical protein